MTNFWAPSLISCHAPRTLVAVGAGVRSLMSSFVYFCLFAPRFALTLTLLSLSLCVFVVVLVCRADVMLRTATSGGGRRTASTSP